MKPFKAIQTKHLGMLLIVARVMFFIGLLFVPVALLVFLWALTNTAFAVIAPVIMSLLYAIPFVLAIFAMSCLLAAVVAFEESYRKRTELMMKSAETE